ncbi:MAG: hypothetical protein Q7V88_10585 [Actinomycetota bacterium]|nr:hypothetical protein [Actinomycetota bacterium]
MKASRPTTRLLVATVGALSLFGAACSDDDTTTTTAAPTTEAAGDPTTTVADVETTMAETTVPATDPMVMYEGDLVGLFSIDAGACADGAVTGSYFQMVMPGGTAEAGPFIGNADSACADTNYSLLAAGADGGLMTGAAQAAPDPAFDATGNGLADSIVAPVTFFAVAFAAATDPNEAMPMVSAADGVLTGDLSAFTAYYGTGIFNQGAPKPDGSGAAPTGTIDPETGVYTLEWTSLIVGGSFDGFTGVWHLEGTFAPNG